VQKKEYTQEEIDKIFDDLHAGPVGRRTEAQWDSSFRLSQPKSDEFKASISKLHRGKKVNKSVVENLKNKNRIAIIATNILTGESIEYRSQKEASIALNMYVVYINNVLKGRYKTAKGYTFTYA